MNLIEKYRRSDPAKRDLLRQGLKTYKGEARDYAERLKQAFDEIDESEVLEAEVVEVEV
mgnify:CR=1 FL=1